VRQPQEAGDEAEYFGLRCVGEGRVVSPRVALTPPKAGNFDDWILAFWLVSKIAGIESVQ